MRRLLPLFLTFFIVLGACSQAPDTYLVDWVVDGDTFHVTSLDASVRIADIDAPELHEPDGEDAKWFLIYLIYDKEVVLDCELERDVYDRHLCLVYLDGKSVSDMLMNEFETVRRWE